MLQLSEDELQRIRNAIQAKQIFLVVDERTPSGSPNLNILVGSLETPRVSYQYQLTMWLELLELTQTLIICYCLMLQNIW